MLCSRITKRNKLAKNRTFYLIDPCHFHDYMNQWIISSKNKYLKRSRDRYKIFISNSHMRCLQTKVTSSDNKPHQSQQDASIYSET